ncbi:hypothetical protein F7R91_20145 [Streptomyces luteolifulvus]|uniref:Uncharacterized protein n=1 Tax=Streptomyces luteolifulvus TaxID=2615112 RepID=A0A6H9UX44_9ACTN|nr:hypothetical protein [Streptomyces luteolifulvus]KAB1144989.1 hypothetical protein F7R91_20145 [Streptomyces luteolifulvus]
MEARLRENQEDCDNGLKTRAQYFDSNERNLGRLREVEARIAEAGGDGTGGPFSELVRRSDPAAVWDRLDLGVRRMVLREIAVVTVLPGPRVRRPGSGYSDPTSVLVEPNRAGQ